MGQYTVTLPNGGVYDVESGSAEQAHKDATEFAAKESADAIKKDYSEASPLTKTRMTLDDSMRGIAKGLTAGMFDKAMSLIPGMETSVQDTRNAEIRSPTASTVGNVAGAVMLPSGAPAATAAVGGGPLARGITGALTAGAEGATYGGVNAAAGDQPVLPGILAGGIGGLAGQATAQAIAPGVNAGVKAIRGIDDALPPRNMTTFGAIKTPSARDRIDVAASKAAHRGNVADSSAATQAAQKAEFGKLLTGPNKKDFTPKQRELMGKISYGDIGTNLSSTIGKALDDKLLAASIGAGAGIGTGGVLPGMLAAGGALAGGKILQRDSAKATQEAVDELRRLVNKKPAFKGPMTADKTRRIGQALGYLSREGLENY